MTSNNTSNEHIHALLNLVNNNGNINISSYEDQPNLEKTPTNADIFAINDNIIIKTSKTNEIDNFKLVDEDNFTPDNGIWDTLYDEHNSIKEKLNSPKKTETTKKYEENNPYHNN
jgi:hypothetical protein